MTMDPGEKAKLDAEWNRMRGLGKRLARQRAIATLAGMGVLAVIWLPLAIFGGIRGGIGGFVVGMMAAWPVRNKLWPKGQFS
jgi:hypothetical protein